MLTVLDEYTRVEESHGLESQETRCREYAKAKGYEVVKVFYDDITGKVADRLEFNEMLKWLRSRKKYTDHAVILDDISRFARGIQAHWDLRALPVGVSLPKWKFARFYENHPEFPKNRQGKVFVRRVKEMPKRVLYAGYLTLPNWGLSMIPAKHEGLIDLDTFNRIQERLTTPTKAPARADLHQDFPLRGFVACGCCENPMTSNWATGRDKKYPYYQCYNCDCKEYGKSMKRDQLEGDFETLLTELKPSPDLFQMAYAMFNKIWTQSMESDKEQATRLKYEQAQIERKVDRIGDIDSDSVAKAYEKKSVILSSNVRK